MKAMMTIRKPRIELFIVVFLFVFIQCTDTSNARHKTEKIQNERPEYALVIHGGAGTIRKSQITDEEEASIRQALDAALVAGESILKNGGTALDAIEQSIMILEDSPHFNAGKGAVFTNAGTNELDASIMDGSSMNAGAVGGVRMIKNPILGARAVMEKSPHVLLTGAGADTFCVTQKLETVDSDYFYTERRWKALQRVLESERKKEKITPQKRGTVGAVALDRKGNIAAGTSTGGMTNKRYNRIGDSPIIGAGTYANNKTCGVSSTGHGEFFIRYAVAHDISALIEYKGMTANEAAEEVVNRKLVDVGGAGGVIAIDKDGNIAMPFNTEGMYRGYAVPGKRKTLLYKGEE